jgi:hypothetical protein
MGMANATPMAIRTALRKVGRERDIECVLGKDAPL